MRAEILLFWLVVGVAFGTAAALVGLGYWPLAIPLAVAAVAHLFAPRPEPPKGEGGASRHVFSFRREILFILGCLLVVLIAAYR